MNNYIITFLCDKQIEKDDLFDLFTTCGLYLKAISSDGRQVSCDTYRSSEPKKKSLYKLFKNLNRAYKIISLTIVANEIRKTPKNVILSGSGVRASLELEANIVRKNYLNTPEVINTYLRNEICARSYLEHVKGVVPCLEISDKGFTMPYIPNEYQFDPDGIKLFSLAHFDKVMAFMNEVWSKGCCLVDWNVDAFRFHNGQVFFVDYEYCYQHSTPSQYETSPDISGVGQEKKTALGNSISFDNYWRQYLGLTYDEYKNYDLKELKSIRRKYFMKQHLPQYLLKKMNSILSRFKNSLKYRVTYLENTIVIRKR